LVLRMRFSWEKAWENCKTGLKYRPIKTRPPLGFGTFIPAKRFSLLLPMVYPAYQVHVTLANWHDSPKWLRAGSQTIMSLAYRGLDGMLVIFPYPLQWRSDKLSHS
jgi:hypothetical protein